MRRVEVVLTAEEVERLAYAASYAAQGPLGQVDPRLVRRLERWLQRGGPTRVRLDRPTLHALLALAPLYGAYREHRRETVPLYPRAWTPTDTEAAALEARLRAALARLEPATPASRAPSAPGREMPERAPGGPEQP
ncbi:MAG TPA: hypothetical protein VFB73_10645 [Chloroflexota bacterium]|nr:hypothetical protein [Chloroflexota bacterium]